MPEPAPDGTADEAIEDSCARAVGPLSVSGAGSVARVGFTTEFNRRAKAKI